MRFNKASSITECYVYSVKYIQNRKLEREVNKEIEDYEENGEENYQVCSFFGCGKKLRLEETLAGGRCCKHSGK